jgi:hypothetical protein
MATAQSAVGVGIPSLSDGSDITAAQAAHKMKPIEALNRLTEISFGFTRSQMFFVACRLSVFDHLATGPATAAELGEQLRIHPEGCRRLLAGLRSLGLVESEGDLFRNSELGSFLTTSSPVQLEPLSMMGDPFYHMWEFLPDALREYGPRWQQALGTTQTEVFGALYEDPARMRRFAACQNAFSVPQGQLLAEVFDFSPHHCLLDVGGNSGGISIQVGLKYPHLRGIIMDLPAVCNMAEEYIQANGVADRFKAVPGDLFEGTLSHWSGPHHARLDPARLERGKRS